MDSSSLNKMHNNLSNAPQPFQNSVHPFERAEAKFAKYRTLMLKRKKICYIVGGVFASFLALGALSLLVIGGAFPCLLVKCHKNAKLCINRPFYAQCVCDYGYSGNGKTICDVCGLTYSPPDLRIVGGKPAIPYSWPSAAHVVQSYKGDFIINGIALTLSISFQCGGTIINRQTILTAAHCVSKTFEYRQYTLAITLNSYYPTWESMFTVYTGLYTTNGLLSNQGFDDKIDVSKIIKHESYNEESVLNDIAIFKLKKSINLNNRVQPVCLPNETSNDFPGVDLSAYIIGWGKTDVLGAAASPILQNALIYIYNSSMCANVFRDFQKNWNSQICAGNYSGGVDTCQGDSGSGLFINTQIEGIKRQMHVGVVSYGYLCGEPGYPGIYTRTSYFLDWIVKNYDF